MSSSAARVRPWVIAIAGFGSMGYAIGSWLPDAPDDASLARIVEHRIADRIAREHPDAGLTVETEYGVRYQSGSNQEERYAIRLATLTSDRATFSVRRIVGVRRDTTIWTLRHRNRRIQSLEPSGDEEVEFVFSHTHPVPPLPPQPNVDRSATRRDVRGELR